MSDNQNLSLGNGSSYGQSQLERQARQEAERQRGIAALAATGQALSQRVRQGGAERFQADIEHHTRLLEQVKKTGDATQIRKMEEFYDLSLNDAATSYLRSGRTCDSALDNTIREYASYDIPPRQSLLKKLTGG